MFGILMGAGAVLAVGMLVSGKAENRKQKAEMGGKHMASNVQHRTSDWWVWVKRGLHVVAAWVMGVGLVKSYSRGAWAATAVGMVYLVNHREKLKC